MTNIKLAIVAVTAVVSSVASAQTPVITTNGTSQAGSGSFNVGYTFNTTQAIQVTHLAWNSSATNNATVGIWNSAGTLLGSAVVSSSASVVNGYRWAALANSINLAIGTGYTIGGNGNAWRSKFTLAPTTSMGVTYGASRWANGTTFVRPTNNDASFTNSYFGPNFAAVPEPGTMAILGLGVVAALRRRRKA